MEEVEDRDSCNWVVLLLLLALCRKYAIPNLRGVWVRFWERGEGILDNMAMGKGEGDDRSGLVGYW